MLKEKVMEPPQSEQIGTVIRRPGEVKGVVVLLYIFAAIEAIGLLAGDLMCIIPIAINLVLADGLLKMKSWARTWTIIRSATGVILTLLLLGTLQEVSGDAIPLLVALGTFDLICFALTIVMLTKARVRKSPWR